MHSVAQPPGKATTRVPGLDGKNCPPPEISFVIALYNQLEMTKACLASIERTMEGYSYEVILIDDASWDGTREFLPTLPSSHRIWINEKRSGFAENNNRGARMAVSPLLCFLNNDTVLLPGWFAPMKEGLESLPKAGILGNVQWSPRIRANDHMGVVFGPDGVPSHFGKHFFRRPYKGFTEWGAVTAACCLIRRDLFLEQGGFDTVFFNGSEDVDLCLRLSQKGYRHYVANESLIHHHVSSSPGRDDAKVRNESILQDRWKNYILKVWSPRDEALHYINYGFRFLTKPWRYNGAKLLESVRFGLQHPLLVLKALGLGKSKGAIGNRQDIPALHKDESPKRSVAA